MLIRNETSSDSNKISEVTLAAFKLVSVSNQTEPFIINALRKANVLSVSLVAEIDGRVVGHIAFSPVTVSDGATGWYGLGPVSVEPEFQRQGIGSVLIKQGLDRIQAMGAKGCTLVGDPNYYKRFGFKNYPDLTHEGIPQEVFLALPFGKEIPQGNVVFHQAFQAKE